MQTLTAFKGDALIYRKAAGVLSNPLDRDASAWLTARLGRVSGGNELLILSHLLLDDSGTMI